MGGIARKNGYKALAIGGMPDHVHVLLSLPATMNVAKAVQLIKGGSSKWLRERNAEFNWQGAYSAFSVSQSQLTRTIRYVKTQEIHHRKRNYEEELRQLLQLHGISFDEKYLLD